MSFVGDAIGSVGDFLGDTVGAITGGGAADAATEGAQVAAQGQREALDYLKQKESLPMQFRDEALPQLAGLFGLGGNLQDSPLYQSFMSSPEGTPMYNAIMGQKEDALREGESAILRNASATGGLRSGNVNDALSRFAGNLDSRLQTQAYMTANDQKNQALRQSLGGIQGLAGLQGNTGAIANTIAGIGNTQAQGITAAAQARQQGIGNTLQLGMNGLALAGFSDARLKESVEHVGERNGHNWYSWTWSEEAKALGLEGPAEGFMAHEIIADVPEAVYTKGDYLVVDYKKLGVH